MKNQELLLACAVISIVSGVGATLATRAFEAGAVRSSEPRASVTESSAAAPASDDSAAREIVELRRTNVALAERLSALEARLSDASSTRTPATPVVAESTSVATRAASDSPGAAALLDPSFEVTPTFVASVGQALDTIKAREDAEREAKRKEIQAQRVEERVAKLQQDLGLSSRQATDLRTALIAQDDKREALYSSVRDGLADPRDMRDSFRQLHEETSQTVQGILTPEQFEGYVKSEDDFGRRGPPDWGGGRPPGGDFGFGRDSGRDGGRPSGSRPQ